MMRRILALCLIAVLGGCATTRNADALAANDPYEGFNRGVWAFNDAVDTVAIKPVTTVYRTVTPRPARRGLSRVIANLGEPFNFINNLLQGKPDRAFRSLGRFFVNTTIGVGGLADHATDLGLPPAREDFGQTLAVGGARKSPYLVLPLLGPSTVRDAVGTAVQFVADPAQVVINTELSQTEQAAVAGTRVIDTRSQLIDSGADAVLETSADPYAAARSAYFQRRAAEIRDEEEGAALLTPEEEEKLLKDALGDSPAPDAPPEEELQPPEEEPSESDCPSGDETALLDIIPSDVLREDAVSGGFNY